LTGVKKYFALGLASWIALARHSFSLEGLKTTFAYNDIRFWFGTTRDVKYKLYRDFYLFVL
jgi:hypothetical protein